MADTFKATNLLPEVNNIKRYHVLEWLNYVATELHKTVGSLFHKGLSEGEKHSIHQQISAKLDFINYHLSSNDYLAGEVFTLPDTYFYVILTWLLICKVDLNQWPNVGDILKHLCIVHPSLMH